MATLEPDRHRARNRPLTSIRLPPCSPAKGRIPLRKLLRVASVACGIQFGWALQLSLIVAVAVSISFSVLNIGHSAILLVHHWIMKKGLNIQAMLKKLFSGSYLELLDISQGLNGQILYVTALPWIRWMGREIYGGKPNEGQTYNTGGRMGALGLMLNSVFLVVTSILMKKFCRKWGAGFIQGVSNIIMAICSLAILILLYVAQHMGYVGHDMPPNGIVIAALVIFSDLGVPLAIIYIVPYALILTPIYRVFGTWPRFINGCFKSGNCHSTGQGRGVLGKWTIGSAIRWGNSLAFAAAAVAAFIIGLIAILAIPRSSASAQSQKPGPSYEHCCQTIRDKESDEKASGEFLRRYISQPAGNVGEVKVYDDTGRVSIAEEWSYHDASESHSFCA